MAVNWKNKTTGNVSDTPQQDEQVFNALLGPLTGKTGSYQIGDTNAYQVNELDTSGVQDATTAALAEGASLQAPTATAAEAFGGVQLDTTGQQQWADMQTALAEKAMGIATGQAPSAAEMMLKQSQERNLGNMMAAAAASGDGNYGMGQRQMLEALGDANLQSEQQMAAVRSQEQEKAMGLAAGLAGQARGQELDMATTQANFLQQAGLQGAEFQQQVAMLNPQLQLQTMQLSQRYMEMAQNGEISMMEAAIAMEEIAANAYAQQQATQAQIDAANLQAMQGADETIIDKIF